MNILEDKDYGKIYAFHVGDLLGNILFTLRLNDIKPSEISIDLLGTYMCILAKKYTEDRIKVVFAITQEEILNFLKENNDSYKISDDKNKIIVLKELDAVELAKKHHNSMPFKVLNATVKGQVQSKLIDAYNEEKPKVLEKKTIN